MSDMTGSEAMGIAAADLKSLSETAPSRQPDTLTAEKRMRLLIAQRTRALSVTLAGLLLAGQLVYSDRARADNPMGYRLLSAREAAGMPRGGGSLGLAIQEGPQINDDGMSFNILRIRGVRSGSPGQHAGLAAGDQIIAVNGRVFDNLGAFVGYVGAMRPGDAVNIDYIPVNGGPAQAQRVRVTVASATGASVHEGMSTREKVAIGVGAAALLGCYELGCFSHRQQQHAPASAGAWDARGQP